MANIIQIKRKTTTGAPSLLQLSVGEFCFVVPDEALYLKKDASTIVQFPHSGQLSGGGDMSQATYDTNGDGKVNSADQADNSLQLGGVAASSYATQTYVDNAITALVGGAPGSLDTLNELAEALADDASFSATITASLATKLDANSSIDGGTIS